MNTPDSRTNELQLDEQAAASKIDASQIAAAAIGVCDCCLGKRVVMARVQYDDPLRGGRWCNMEERPCPCCCT